MHEILDILQEWARDFKMSWSAAKTQRLVFKHRGGREPREPRQMYFDDKHIQPMETRALKTKCVSLGMIISKDMQFTDQINKVEHEIRSITLIMGRFFQNKTEWLLTRFYNTYIVPKFTYCCQVWQPGEEKYLRGINQAVAKYWKMNKCRGPRGGPPPNILIPTLHYILIDMMFVHRMLHGEMKLAFEDYFEFREGTTRQNGKLNLPKYGLKFNKHKLTYRAAVFFNMLPTEYYDLPKSLFKKAAKAHILDNQEMYLNLTRDISISDANVNTESKTPFLNEMLNTLKANNLNRESDWMKMGVNMRLKSDTKFWVPLSKQFSEIITENINQEGPTKLPLALSRLL